MSKIPGVEERGTNRRTEKSPCPIFEWRKDVYLSRTSVIPGLPDTWTGQTGIVLYV